MKDKIDQQVNYVRKVANMSKKPLEKQVQTLQNDVKAKQEELDNKDKDIQQKIDKQVNYVRSVNNMSKKGLEKQI